MRTKAAVALAVGKPLEIMEVELEGPRAGEVLVKIKATGLQFTDEFTRSGDDPEGIFPAILDMRVGVVVEVGAGVTSLEVGDHVIPLYTPEAASANIVLILRQTYVRLFDPRKVRFVTRWINAVFDAGWSANPSLHGLFDLCQPYGSS